MAVRVTTPLGEVATTAILRPGTYFGEMALVAPAPRNATVVALEAAETMSIHRREFDALRQQHRAVDQLLIAALADEVRALSSRLLDSLYLPVDTRLARHLADLGHVRPSGRDAGRHPDDAGRPRDARRHDAADRQPGAEGAQSEGVLAVHRGRIDVLDRAGHRTARQRHGRQRSGGPLAHRVVSRSVEVLECFGGASLDVGVPVGRGGGVRLGEKVSSPFGVAGSVAFGEHLPHERLVRAAKNLASARSLNAAAWGSRRRLRRSGRGRWRGRRGSG